MLNTIFSRLAKGWSTERALTAPLRPKGIACSPEERTRILRLHAQGLSARSIATELYALGFPRRSQPTISAWIRRWT